ncbi:hypothetical protein ACFUOZ_15920 [Paenarthrobacter sp. NPDC057355]|uniref:hypothetical protein n=1 Tax=Paenarthrobacter sp. NPDC057355 TaxID=3346105 RepID=UPI00363EC9BE
MDAVDDTVQFSGMDWPIWNRSHTAGFFAGPCSVRTRDDGRAYQTQIEGGPALDPQVAVDLMKAHWEEKGYTIGNVFDDGNPATGIQLNARTSTGVRLQFSPTPHVSFIKVVSACTLDPNARKKTT